MTFHLVGQLPRHLYVKVDTSFTHKENAKKDVGLSGYVDAVWFGLVSYPGRAWGLTVMLESGAVYRNLPPHAIAFHLDDPTGQGWEIDEAQRWDCYGTDFSVIEYRYLSGLDVKTEVANGTVLEGQYLFTVAPIGDGFSAKPEQSKEFSFIELSNGRLTIQPTDKVIFLEKSFNEKTFGFPVGLKRQTDSWSCE